MRPGDVRVGIGFPNQRGDRLEALLVAQSPTGTELCAAGTGNGVRKKRATTGVCVYLFLCLGVGALFWRLKELCLNEIRWEEVRESQ